MSIACHSDHCWKTCFVCVGFRVLVCATVCVSSPVPWRTTQQPSSSRPQRVATGIGCVNNNNRNNNISWISNNNNSGDGGGNINNNNNMWCGLCIAFCLRVPSLRNVPCECIVQTTVPVLAADGCWLMAAGCLPAAAASVSASAAASADDAVAVATAASIFRVLSW